jgi:hypothetical protein
VYLWLLCGCSVAALCGRSVAALWLQSRVACLSWSLSQARLAMCGAILSSLYPRPVALPLPPRPAGEIAKIAPAIKSVMFSLWRVSPHRGFRKKAWQFNVDFWIFRVSPHGSNQGPSDSREFLQSDSLRTELSQA